MDWDKLRIFHAVAEAGSFTHAGDTLNLSQSAVSRQISSLEQSLEVPLAVIEAFLNDREKVLAFRTPVLKTVARHYRKKVANSDALTGLVNRTGFMTAMKGAAHEFKTFSVVFIDLNKFKPINDTYGHDHGDEALRIIAAEIRGQVRKGDLVGRLGGEEFGVFLPGASQENAVSVAERIRRAVNEMSFRPRGTRHPLSVSVGGVSFEDQLEFVELYRIADRRLYQAKNGGRNRIELTHVQAYDSNDLRQPLH